MNNIAKLRKAKKLSQQQLADLLGFSHQTISNYEQEKTELDYQTIKKLAAFFNTSIDYLLGNESEYIFISKSKFKKIEKATKVFQEFIDECNVQLDKSNKTNINQGIGYLETNNGNIVFKQEKDKEDN